jgi:hypothetical protein
MQRGIDELNEFLLYTRPEEYSKYSEVLLNCLFSVVKLFSDQIEIVMLTTQAILEIVTSSPEISIPLLQKNNFYKIIIELIDLCICLQK